ncbi:hypothetical protein J6590_062961 [Homalodisca vitripennis]|nr:hypothetical protein J6590_062961 [Homalodisca vitripennis]
MALAQYFFSNPTKKRKALRLCAGEIGEIPTPRTMRITWHPELDKYVKKPLKETNALRIVPYHHGHHFRSNTKAGMRHALPKLRRKDKLKYLQYVYPEQHTTKFEEKVCEDTRLASCRRVRQRHPRLTLALTDIADTSCEIETLRETWTTMEYVPLGKSETSSDVVALEHLKS